MGDSIVPRLPFLVALPNWLQSLWVYRFITPISSRWHECLLGVVYLFLIPINVPWNPLLFLGQDSLSHLLNFISFIYASVCVGMYICVYLHSTSRINKLGSGSDFEAYFQRLGIASGRARYTKNRVSHFIFWDTVLPPTFFWLRILSLFVWYRHSGHCRDRVRLHVPL